jgi:hypothetical protein
MKIYLVPFTITTEENEREIKKKTFGLEFISAPNFWYLHGALVDKFRFDKAYMYVDWETFKSDIVEEHNGDPYLATGIYDVEVEGYDKPCKAFMWQSEESGKILLRGLVVDPTVEEDIKDAQKKYEEKPLIL